MNRRTSMVRSLHLVGPSPKIEGELLVAISLIRLLKGMSTMLKEKVRIFALARELGMESKELVALCRQNGIDVMSTLSTIEPEVRDQIVALVHDQERNKPARSGIDLAKTKDKAAPTPPLVRQLQALIA